MPARVGHRAARGPRSILAAIARAGDGSRDLRARCINDFWFSNWRWGRAESVRAAVDAGARPRFATESSFTGAQASAWLSIMADVLAVAARDGATVTDAFAAFRAALLVHSLEAPPASRALWAPPAAAAAAEFFART